MAASGTCRVSGSTGFESPHASECICAASRRTWCARCLSWVPTERTLLRGRWPMAWGMALYSLLVRDGECDDDSRLPSGTYLDRSELDREAPTLSASSRFTGAFVLNEFHLHSSERMTLAFLKTAVKHGAVVANYLISESLLREGSRIARCTGARRRPWRRSVHPCQDHGKRSWSLAARPERTLSRRAATTSGDRLCTRGAHRDSSDPA